MERLTELLEKNRNIRIVVPKDLYDRLKDLCPEHGQLSQLVRKLIIKHLENSEG